MLRINLFGGPGVGKSILAASIYAFLARKGHQIELVREYIKNWCYLDRHCQGVDQVYVFSKQLHQEDILLRNGVSIVTDSPLWLNAAYTHRYGVPGASSLDDLCRNMDSQYPALNLRLSRTVSYQKLGRYEDFEAALNMDRFLDTYLGENKVECLIVDPQDTDGVYTQIENVLNRCGQEMELQNTPN